MIRTRGIAILLALTALSACDRSEQPSDQTVRYLKYTANIGEDHSEHEPVTPCYVVGPHEIVVLVEVVEEEWFQIGRSCTDVDPYLTDYLLRGARVLATAVPAEPGEIEPGETVNVIDFDNHPGYHRPAKAGDTELWSIRRGGDEWFLRFRLPATPSATPFDDSSQTDQLGFELPTEWAELQQVLRETRANHESRCTDPFQEAYGRRMTPTEFDVFMHTPGNEHTTACPVGTPWTPDMGMGDMN